MVDFLHLSNLVILDRAQRSGLHWTVALHTVRIWEGWQSVQSRKMSLAEAVINTAIGFGVSLVTWIVLQHTYGIPMSFGDSLQITAWFTIVSIIRQYVLRRFFNRRTPKV